MSIGSAAALEVAGLGVRYPAGRGFATAIERLDLRVEAGESFGLVGESGSGKSTVLKAIAGLVPEATGTIRVEGRVVGLKRSRAERRRLQFVFQDPYGSLHPRHTVERVLREPIRIHDLGDAQGRVRAALAAVGLDPTHLFRYPHQLSGGQRQRVAIARALVLEPRILLLDEPTSALDVSIQAEILNLLALLRRQRGLTYLMVSHDLAVVAHLCDRIAVMRRGGVVEHLTATELRAGHATAPYTRALLASFSGERSATGRKPAVPAPDRTDGTVE